MMNCGLTDLRLVAPRDGWPNPAALPMAAGGVSIIENAGVFDSIADAAHDLTFLAALSARRRDLPVRTSDPRGVMAEMLSNGRRAGLMFGPEASGLDNDDVVRADCLVTADLNPDYPSLRSCAGCVADGVGVACGRAFRRKRLSGYQSVVGNGHGV